MGWRGAADHWQRYDTAYLLLAALATPLVVSVHRVVSFDFAVGVVPGWHSTIFPPYFVAGAIFSGFAMVMTLADPAAQDLRAGRVDHDAPSGQHGQGDVGDRSVCRLWLSDRGFTAWYSGNQYEHFWLFNRTLGPFGWAFWAADAVQHRRAADALVWARAGEPALALLSPSSSISACGWNVLSSLS